MTKNKRERFHYKAYYLRKNKEWYFLPTSTCSFSKRGKIYDEYCNGVFIFLWHGWLAACVQYETPLMTKLAVLLHQSSYQKENHFLHCYQHYLPHINQMTSSRISSPVCRWNLIRQDE